MRVLVQIDILHTSTWRLSELERVESQTLFYTFAAKSMPPTLFLRCENRVICNIRPSPTSTATSFQPNMEFWFIVPSQLDHFYHTYIDVLSTASQFGTSKFLIQEHLALRR